MSLLGMQPQAVRWPVSLDALAAVSMPGQEGELPGGVPARPHQRILRAQAADEGIVDTFVFMDAQGTQVDAFGAGGQFQPVRPAGVEGRDAPASSRISSTVGAR